MRRRSPGLLVPQLLVMLEAKHEMKEASDV
jgi:hypothetical protein